MGFYNITLKICYINIIVEYFFIREYFVLWKGMNSIFITLKFCYVGIHTEILLYQVAKYDKQ
jgi:hypothetical protein